MVVTTTGGKSGSSNAGLYQLHQCRARGWREATTTRTVVNATQIEAFTSAGIPGGADIIVTTASNKFRNNRSEALHLHGWGPRQNHDWPQSASRRAATPSPSRQQLVPGTNRNGTTATLADFDVKDDALKKFRATFGNGNHLRRRRRTRHHPSLSFSGFAQAFDALAKE